MSLTATTDTTTTAAGEQGRGGERRQRESQGRYTRQGYLKDGFVVSSDDEEASDQALASLRAHQTRIRHERARRAAAYAGKRIACGLPADDEAESESLDSSSDA